MPYEQVSLVAGGYRWSAWTRTNITYGIKNAVRTFAFTLTDTAPWEGKWNFMPGTDVKVYAANDMVCNGYVNTMAPHFDAKNHVVEISGRSKSQDSVDSSAEHDSYEFKNKTVLEIAQALDKQGVNFRADVPLKKIPLFRASPGETVFEAVERAGRKENLLYVGQGDGSVLITRGGSKRVHPALIEGYNILGGGASFSDLDKHSTYKVRGQRTYGSQSRKSLRIEAEAEDKTVKRNRPLHILPESDMDENEAKQRAQNHRDKTQANSVTATIKVRGWRDMTGLLWVPNTLIFISAPTLKLNNDMLLESVSLTQDEQGTLSQLSFVQPSALGSKAKTGSRTDSVWDNPNDFEEVETE